MGNRKKLFLQKLAALRRDSELTKNIFEEIPAVADDSTEEAFADRVSILKKVCAILDECLRRLHEEPSDFIGADHRSTVRDLYQRLVGVSGPAARYNVILTYANDLLRLRVAEYLDLVASSQAAGGYVNRIVTSKMLAVGMLLESCFVERFPSVERIRGRMRVFVRLGKTRSLAA